MTTRTEQETRRGAPVRGAAPKTGQRRPGVPHQSKPIPRPRPADEGARAAAPSSPRPATVRVNRVRRASARRQRTPFVLLIVGLLCGGLVSLLLLNTVLAQDSIKAGQLRDQIAEQRLQNETAKNKLIQDGQPANLADQAERQGMRQDLDNVNVIRGASQDATQVGQGR